MPPNRVQRIVESLAVGAILASAAMLAFGAVPTSAEWRAAIFFTGFGVLASALGYKTSKATTGNIGFLPFLSIAVISPNVAALVTVFASVLAAELIARRPILKVVFNVSQFVFAEALAVWVYLALGGSSMLRGYSGISLGQDVSDTAPPVVAFFIMVALWLTINKLAVSTVVSAADGRDTRAHWLGSMRVSATYDLFSFPLIYFFAVAYVEWGPVLSSALAFPMLGIRQLYKSNVALQKINEELLQLMAATVEAQDPYTSGHSQRVARFARIISKAFGLGSRVTDRIVTAALLHDVGKIYVEFAPILRKPGRLTEAEFAVMKTHSVRGAVLVEKVSHFEDLVPMVLHHHEAWDGSGYPHGIAADDIPLGARIIALADTIDAMSTSRPYRRSMSEAEVRSEIMRERGRQFDPRICDALLAKNGWSAVAREIATAAQETDESSSVVRVMTEVTPIEPRMALGR